jgi:hypothetical protein
LRCLSYETFARTKQRNPFLRLGGQERRTKKNYRMIRMPNGQLIVLPGGILKTGLLRAQIKRGGLTENEFMEALS